MSSEAIALAALQAGSVQIAGISDPIALQETTGNIYPGVVGQDVQAGYFNVVCNNQVPEPAKGELAKDKLQELVGKKIAFTGVGSSAYIELNQSLQYNGLSVSQIQFVNVTAGAPQYAALESGAVACVVGNANVVATQVGGAWGGYKFLTFSDPGVSNPSFAKYVGSFNTTEGWLAGHKKMVIAFERAWSYSVLWLQNPKNLAGAEEATGAAEGPAMASPGPALVDLMKVFLPALTPVWGPSTVRAIYNADLDIGTIKKIPNFNPYQFVAPGAPIDDAAAANLASGGPAAKY